MNRIFTKNFAIVAALCLVGFASVAQAQTDKVTQYVDPGSNSRYEIGVMAVNGYGYVEVTRTMYGTPASRIGLEPGDRILRINGMRISNVQQLRYALHQAARYNSGRLTVEVDNVRARRGDFNAQRYMTLRTYLNGFSPIANYPQPGDYPTPVYTSGK